MREPEEVLFDRMSAIVMAIILILTFAIGRDTAWSDGYEQAYSDCKAGIPDKYRNGGTP